MRPDVQRNLPLGGALVAILLLAAGCGPSSSKPPKFKPHPAKTVLSTLRADLGTEALGIATGAGCTLSAPKELEPIHDDNPPPGSWDSDPPTSGVHSPHWAPWGIYDTPVPDKNVLHNEEHGGVIFWYGPTVGSGLVSAVTGVVRDRQKWLVTPRPKTKGLAFGAWGRLLTCDEAATAKLDATKLKTLAKAWYEAAGSKGSEAEKDIAPYPGDMKTPKPTRDISVS